MKPRIFIGSSIEGLYAAEYIKQFFSPDYDCVIWNEDVFKFNKSFLETLLNSASLFDFGFLIFTKDDLSLVRDKVFETARDNVLFEYGLFLGRLGLDRAFVIVEKGVKIPSDILGYTLTTMETEKDAAGKDIVKEPQIVPELEKLKRQIDGYVRLGHLGLLPSTVIAISYFENFVKLVADWLNENNGRIPCGDKTYKTAKLRIVIPSNFDADLKKRAALYYRNLGLAETSFPSRGRSYPVHLAEMASGDEVIIYDMPSILNGIDKAIDMYFRVGHIGKTEDQKLAENREMSNFVRVLTLLIQEDAFCRDCVEIVDE
ncbi:MAG: nucleotide-binding protein [Bacteroidales bacterium]|nr:nucleotide-binding protein [Bacteroidales bacterium]